MAFEIYKRGQGKYTRVVTFVSGALIGLLLSYFVWSELKITDLANAAWGVYVIYGVPVLLTAGVAAMMFWVAYHRPGSADFMIATEGEMKKVSWSSRKEIVGGTKVVIAVTLVMAVLLASVDLFFSFFFKWINVLQISGR